MRSCGGVTGQSHTTHISIPWPGPSILQLALVLSFFGSLSANLYIKGSDGAGTPEAVLIYFLLKWVMMDAWKRGSTLLCGFHPYKANPSAGPTGVSNDLRRDKLTIGLQHSLQVLLTHWQWEVWDVYICGVLLLLLCRLCLHTTGSQCCFSFLCCRRTVKKL